MRHRPADCGKYGRGLVHFSDLLGGHRQGRRGYAASPGTDGDSKAHRSTRYPSQRLYTGLALLIHCTCSLSSTDEPPEPPGTHYYRTRDDRSALLLIKARPYPNAEYRDPCSSGQCCGHPALPVSGIGVPERRDSILQQDGQRNLLRRRTGRNRLLRGCRRDDTEQKRQNQKDEAGGLGVHKI